MTQPPTPQPDEVAPRTGEQSGGVDVSGGQVRSGRDIAGRDIVTGYSAEAVQRLIVTVGALVFVTAFCFFSGGLIVGIGALQALGKPVRSSEAAALSMQNKLNAIARLPSDTRFTVPFTEDEISSYVRFIAGPPLGLNDGKVRLLEPPGRLIVAGEWKALNNLPVAATFRLGPGDKPLRLESAAAQVLPTGDSPFGWVAVPNAVVEPTVGQIDERLFSNVRIETVRGGIAVTGGVRQPEWSLTGVKK